MLLFTVVAVVSDYCCDKCCSQQLMEMLYWPAGLFAVGRRARLSAPKDLLGSHMPDTPTLTQKAHPEHIKIVCSTTMWYMTTCAWLYLYLHLLDTPYLVLHVFGIKWFIKVLCMTKVVSQMSWSRHNTKHGIRLSVTASMYLQEWHYQCRQYRKCTGTWLPAEAIICIDSTCNLGLSAHLPCRQRAVHWQPNTNKPCTSWCNAYSRQSRSMQCISNGVQKGTY